MTEGQYYAYERFWDQVNREHVLAEANFNNGLAKGEIIGEAKGAKKEKIENALKMKQLNVDISIISQVTGLTADEISSL